MKEKKKTVGQVVTDLAQQTDPGHIKAQELALAMQEDYLKNLLECIDKHYPKYKRSFFVVIITKKEPLLHNVYRNYFFARASCPTPDYDQTVYKYNDEKGQVEYLWTVPSKDACMLYLDNAAFVDPAEADLLKFVQMYADGRLYKLAKKHNGEEPDSNLLIN